MLLISRHSSVLLSVIQFVVAIGLPSLPARAALGADDTLMQAVRTLDIDHPVCDQPLDLSSGRDTFVAVANDLPGVQQYNELAKLYQNENWSELDPAVERFRRVYESSPLVEAALFLSVQSQIDRVKAGNGDIRQAEKNLREALVLYPESTLRPALQSSMANYWMQKGVFEKSHALFKAARDEHPFHDLNCGFQYGLAESAYFLPDLASAKSSFTQLLQKCENRRLKLGASMRLLDIARQRNAKAANQYLALYSPSPSFAKAHFPTLLYQTAEAFYRSADYAKAKHYFTEYLSVGAAPRCGEYATKRLADVALRTQKTTAEALRGYLVARERGPATDVGRFSNTMALLLDLKSVPMPEQERRLKFLDEEISAISNRNYQETAFLLKGLYLADIGHDEAFPYLVRYAERTHRNINQGKVGNFLRTRLLALLDKRLADAAIGKASEFDEAKSKGLVSWLEKSYGLWLKGTPNAQSGRVLYTRLTLDSVKVALATGEIEGGLELLKRWHTNDPKIKAPVTNETKRQLSESLLKGFMASKDVAALAVQYLRIEPDLKPFLARPELVHAIAQIEAGGALNEKSPKFQVADLIPTQSDVKAYQALILGTRYLQDNNPKLASQFLNLTVSSPFQLKAWQPRMRALTEMGAYDRAYALNQTRLTKEPSKENLETLATAVDLVRNGKLWAKGPELLMLAEKNGAKDGELEVYLHLAGEAFYEKGECLKAIAPLERAISSKEVGSAAGSRFRLAKCLGRLGRPGEARAVWAQLAGMRDPFWSPLANAELSLIPKK